MQHLIDRSWRIALMVLVLCLAPGIASTQAADETAPQPAETSTAPTAETAPATPPVPAVDITRPKPAEVAATQVGDLAALPGPPERRWLDAGSTRFLALVTPAAGRHRRGTVLYLPDEGESPETAGLARELASALAGLGWNVWALSPTPVPPTGAASAAPPDTGAAQEQLLQSVFSALDPKDSRRTVIIGHGTAGVNLLDHFPTRATGLVLLDARPVNAGADAALGTQMARMRVPVLDVLAETANETAALALRQNAGQAAKPGPYTQERLLGTDHAFTGVVAFLAHRIGGWGDRLPVSPSTEAP